MKKQKKRFVNGAKENGYSKEFALSLFDQIEKFAGYSFNKCVSGDTELQRSSVNQHVDREITIRELYKKWNSNTSVGKKYRYRGLKILSFDKDGRVRPRKIKKVYKTGKKEVYKIKLSNGNTIKATKDHKFMNNNKEWIKLDNIKKGDYILTRGNYEKSKPEYSLSGKKQKNKRTSVKGKQGFQEGEKNPGYIDGSYIQFKKSKKIAYNRNNGKCERCNKKEGRMEYHHKDGDRTNNEPDNIEYLCNSCHKKADYEIGRNKKWDKGYPVNITKVESIEYVGIEETYDLEMEADNEIEHNYIANNIVTKNSHATAYATISYTTALLKNYFPAEFYSAIMKYEILKSPKESDFKDYLAQCYEKELEVITPDINESSMDFSVNEGKIQYGIRSIKGVGKKASKDIIDNRPYKNFDDFINKVTNCTSIDRTVVEGLIKAGAFDTINSNRKLLLKYYNFINSNKKSNSMGMFTPVQIVGEEETEKEDVVEWEIEVLRASITYPTRWDIKRNNEEITIKGIIKNYNETKDRNNKLMAFAKLKTKFHEINTVIFASVYSKKRHIIEKNNAVKIKGKKSDNSILVNKVEELEDEKISFEKDKEKIREE